MRKQYHFRPSPNGYFAWDVDRLIELSSVTPEPDYIDVQPKDLPNKR